MTGPVADARSEWPIVVGGCHRSGTSLVRRLLNGHPRIHCGPEVPFFRDFHGDYREDPLAHLRFARAARSLLPEDELLDVLGRAFLAVHERAARRAGKARWADKAPENVLHLDGWERLLGREWLLLHVVRNPLDTVASMRAARFPLTLPPDLAGLVSWYRRHVEAGLAYGARHPARARVLVYEELVAGPRAVLGELMAWLGEELAEEQLDVGGPRHGSGLEDPKAAAARDVHGESVGRWGEVLSDEEARSVWAELGPLWRELDPGLRRWRPPRRLAG